MFIFIVESLKNESLMKVKAGSIKDLQQKIGHNFFTIIAKV